MDVSLVGTKSYKTFLEWIYRMDIDINKVDVWDAFDVQGNPRPIPVGPALMKCVKFISMGEAAATRTKALNVDFFKLPHPSDKVNPIDLTDQLRRCKRFIYRK